jgi:hypothetical protein
MRRERWKGEDWYKWGNAERNAAKKEQRRASRAVWMRFGQFAFKLIERERFSRNAQLREDARKLAEQRALKLREEVVQQKDADIKRREKQLELLEEERRWQLHWQAEQQHALTLREKIVEKKEEYIKRRENQLEEDIKRKENHLLVLHEKISKKEANEAERSLPIGWTEHLSPEYGVPYYYNKTLKESTWEFPQCSNF